MVQEEKKQSAKQRYQALVNARTPFLNRAYECAKLTIPTLIPWNSEQSQRNQDPQFDDPWQSIGASGVNTLAAKTLTALFPPSIPFFKLTMTSAEKARLLGMDPNEAAEIASQIDAGLSAVENDIVREIEKTKLRTVLFSVLKHLYVAGNGLIYIGDDPKFFPLYKYVVKRDGAGNVLTIIVRELLDKGGLPPGFVEKNKTSASLPQTSSKHQNNDVEVYTVIERTRAGRWVSWQEAFDEEIPGTRGSYDDDTCPWIAARMIAVDGEDYGWSFVSELYGDLILSDELAKAIGQGAAISSRLLWLLNPNGVTDADDIQNASNGDIVPGRQEDIRALQAEKQADLRVAELVLDKVVARLERAFLMRSSVQRSGERVTAYEIAEMAQEIEETQGGFYSLLARELQDKIARRWLRLLINRGELPAGLRGVVEPVIVTGIEALGRGQEMLRFRGFLADVIQFGQMFPQMIQRLSEQDILNRLMSGHGVEVALKSDEQLAQENQQAQQQAMMQEMISKGTGPAINAMTAGARG